MIQIWLLTRRKPNFCYQLQVSSIYQWSLGPGRQSLNDTIDFLKLSVANWAWINCYWRTTPRLWTHDSLFSLLLAVSCGSFRKPMEAFLCFYPYFFYIYLQQFYLYLLYSPTFFLESAMWLLFGGSTQVLLTGGKVQHYWHNERRLR